MQSSSTQRVSCLPVMPLMRQVFSTDATKRQVFERPQFSSLSRFRPATRGGKSRAATIREQRNRKQTIDQHHRISGLPGAFSTFGRRSELGRAPLKSPTKRDAAANIEDIVVEDALIRLIGDETGDRAHGQPIANSIVSAQGEDFAHVGAATGVVGSHDQGVAALREKLRLRFTV